MKIDYCFHSHTFRCNHAVGDISDYLEVAIKYQFKIYAISDHVFLPGVYNPEIRGDYSLFSDYVSQYQLAKEKYKQIEMYLGFECEYSEVFLDYYRSLLKEKGIDFLICGQHCGFDKNKKLYGYFSPTIPLAVSFDKFKKDIEGAMKCGLFMYIAHPDLFFVATTEVNEECKKMTKDIIDLALKYDAVLEININGFNRNHIRNNKYYVDYPCLYFWKEVAKTNIPVVYGGDYHDPKQIEDQSLEDRLNDLIEKAHIKLTDIKEVYIEYKDKLKKIL